MKKCVVIYNPISGKEKHKESIEDFYTILRKYDYDLELIYTKKKGDAISIMKNLKHPDLVICAGGDGTLNEVITGNLAREDRLLVATLPLGTTNDVGTMYGLKKDYVKNLHLILNGVRKKVDLGIINNRPFTYVAAFGGLVNVPYITSQKLKNKYGHMAYIIQGTKEFFKKTDIFNIMYKVNGKTYTGDYSYIFITNSTNIGGKKNVFPMTKLNDKLLEVTFIKSKSKWSLFKTLICILTSKTDKIKDLEFYQTNKLEIIFNNSTSCNWCIDGEQYNVNTNKFKFSINSDTSLLVPDVNVEKLFK